MPEKKTKSGVPYSIEGRRFNWTANYFDPDEDFPQFEVSLPLRMKLGKIIDVGATEDMDADRMMRLVAEIMPGQADKIRDMDVNDFQEMFTTWQEEYSALYGVRPGESGGSSI